MRFFTRLPLSRKLIAITMLTSTAVIVLLALAVSINEVVRQKRILYEKRTEQLTTVAEIIGSRSTAALIFDDRSTAQENLNALQALRANNSIAYAAIHRPDGTPFAVYQNSAIPTQLHQQALATLCLQASSENRDQLLPVCTGVLLGQEHLGEVRIVFDMSSDLDQLQASLLFYLLFLLLLVLIALALAWALSYRLQSLISGPILALQSAAENVARDKDYAVRVPPASGDELAALVDSFNEMLSQIQSRDAELARYSIELEQQVQARSAELAEANRKRVIWLENLAYFLRHELKNSTLGVRSSLELIERRTRASGNSDSIAKYLQRARDSVSFMTKLLENVGSASTLESDFGNETLVPLDLGELVSGQIETYQSIYHNKALLANCQPGVQVLGNSTRLIQLLDKLVSNAVDYGSPETPIIVTVRHEQKQAILSVANQGEPLPEDKQHIFELFVSQRDAAHKDNGNLGLGLYVVKLIAEAHGGTVQAEDLPARSGALFTVNLPRL
ncbi:MAG: HAMP domain-containing protein [Candidatus Competibacteraceae bacterium]|nr:HAMP domain-containing protein [Candidatus Competibacteraceae bacterium]